MRGIVAKFALMCLVAAQGVAQVALSPAQGGTGKSGSSLVHNLASALTCPDSSGSGTAQSCSTSPAYTPAAGDWVIYSTTTSNTGDVTVDVNSLGAKHVRKWLGAATLASGDLPSGVSVPMYYDGTYWELVSIGNPPATGGTISVNGSPVSSPNLNDSTPAAATNGYNVKLQCSGSDCSGYVPSYGTIKYTVSFIGAVGASATGLIPVGNASTLPANLATPTTTCKCGTNPTGSFAITLKDGTSTIATITLDSSCGATLATTGGTTQSLSVDDQFYAIAPSSADATAANISCIVRAKRN